MCMKRIRGSGGLRGLESGLWGLAAGTGNDCLVCLGKISKKGLMSLV